MRYQITSYNYEYSKNIFDSILSNIKNDSIFKVFRILENLKSNDSNNNYKFENISIIDNFGCDNLIELSTNTYYSFKYSVEILEDNKIYGFNNKYSAIKFINEYLERYYNFMYC